MEGIEMERGETRWLIFISVILVSKEEEMKI